MRPIARRRQEPGRFFRGDNAMADADVSHAYPTLLYQVVKRVSCDPFDVSSFDMSTRFKSVRLREAQATPAAPVFKQSST